MKQKQNFEDLEEFFVIWFAVGFTMGMSIGLFMGGAL